MKRSPRLNRLSVMTRLVVALGVMSLVVLVLDSAVLGATPVDIFQDMESGNASDMLTSTIMNASSHGGESTWSVSSGSLWVATNYARNLPAPVVVNGTTYSGTGGTRTWAINDNYSLNFVVGTLAGEYSKLTVACHYTPTVTINPTNGFDHIVVLGAGVFACFGLGYDNTNHLSVGVESNIENYVSTSSPVISVTSGKTYWINMHFDGAAGLTSCAAFDPDNGYAQVGTTVSCSSLLNSTLDRGVRIGRSDAHGNNTLATSKTYLDNLIIDYTNGAFPLIPSSGTDTTPPSAPPTVRDGTGTDIAYTTSTTQLSANWDTSTDNESGISGYQYAIGTSAGGTQTVNWTSLGNVTTVTKTGLSLTSGQTYFFSVKAINGVGLTGNATNSNGQKVDTSAPTAPATVRDGTGTDISTTSSTTQLSANWDASADSESGISGYQYAIGTTAGGTQTVNWTSPGNVTTVTKTGLSLTNGQTYYFSVKAVNGAGLTGSATNSNGQTVQTTDSTPPSAPATVRDGTGADLSTTSSTTQLSANWDACTDAESGISGYQYAIGTTAGGTQTVNWTSLGNVTTVTKTGLSLTVGQTYYFSVKAVNGAGLTGNATNSNGQTVVSGGSTTYFSDNFESWTVHGGAWSSVSGESATHTLNTSTDYAAAGTKGLKITDTDTTSSSGACLVKNFSPAISADIYVRFYVFFPTAYGSTNSGCVRRILRVWCASNRAQMSFKDDVPNMEEVGAWGSAKGSAISEGAWHCIEMHGATPSASTLMEFWVDGVKNSGTLNGGFNGSTTWDYIELGDVVLGGGTNGTGAFYMDEVVVSNSYVGPLGTDSTPPSAPPAVRDGTGTDISTTSSTTQLSANWDASTDAESGISGYQYAIGTTAGGTQTVNWTSLGNVTTVTKTGLSLTVGQTYYFSVKAVNGAGLTGTATNSNGQTVVTGTPVTYFSDSFENWTVHGGAWSSVNGESASHTIDTSGDHAKDGSHCLKTTDTDTTATTGASLTKNFSPTISGDIYVRFYVLFPTGYGSTNSGCKRRMLRVWCGSNVGEISFLKLTPIMEEVGSGTSVTAGSANPEGSWHSVEIHMAAPSASTAMEFWVDGTSVGTLTGSFSGSSTYDHIDFGDVVLASGSSNGTGTLYFDKVIVSNSYNGP